MANQTNQLGIYVDIGRSSVPRLNFTLGGHTTNVDIDGPGAAHLGASLLTASFLSGINQEISVGTTVMPGQLPIGAVEGVVDSSTNLPTLKLEIIGGATLTLVFSADLAAIAATSLAQQVRDVTPVDDDELENNRTN